MSHLDGDDDLIANMDRGLVIGLGMDDRQEIFRPFEHGLEAPAERFKQVLVGIVDDLELIGEENDAGCVCVVQSDLCFIGEHSSDYTKPLTNKKKIVLCLYYE